MDSGCSSTILMRRIVDKLDPEKDAAMQRKTQAGNIATNFKVQVDFISPKLSMTNFVTFKCHVYDSTRGGYYMILGRYLLTELGLDLKTQTRH